MVCYVRKADGGNLSVCLRSVLHAPVSSVSGRTGWWQQWEMSLASNSAVLGAWQEQTFPKGTYQKEPFTCGNFTVNKNPQQLP